MKRRKESNVLPPQEEVYESIFTPDEVKPLTRNTPFRNNSVHGRDGGDGPGHTETTVASANELLLRSAEVGDTPTVKALLRFNPDLDVDCQDILGRTPLTIAVANEHLEVVELLLDRSNHFNVYESLLMAIQLDHDDIAEKILISPKYEEIQRHQQLVGRNDFFLTPVGKESKFSAEVTPLVLAAQRNRFEIALLLLQKGEIIAKPHKYNCACDDCKRKRCFDELKFAKWRLNTFKGLASEAYISLSSKDPILTAFELSNELRQLSAREKHYRGEYDTLANKLCDYVVKLLDQVRGNTELDVILNEQKGLLIWGESTDKLARLLLALKYEQKKFVAHASCQKKLSTLWYSDWQIFDRVPFLLKPLLAIVFAAIFPLLAVLYLFLPKSPVGRFLRIPFIRFIARTCSAITFTILIVVASLTDNAGFAAFQPPTDFPQYHRLATEYFANLTGVYSKMAEFRIRHTTPSAMQLVLSIWIIGLLWQECKQLYREGYEDYFNSMYNLMDMGMLAAYLAAFTLSYVQVMKVNLAISYFSSRENWDRLVANDRTARSHAYWLNSDRYYWLAMDPVNLAEATFAAANVLSLSRLSNLMAASEHLGPLQISLARMVKDVMKFMAIFTLLLVAFMIGLNNLYWYYNPDVRGKVELADHGIETEAEKNFGSIEQTFITVYWALFGMGEKNAVELGDKYDKGFTERFGYVMFGLYNWAMVLMLLNMLIAMMSMSFEIIQSDSDTEWKFSRSQLYMEYIREGSTLPPPFNIIPSPKSVMYLFRLCCKSLKNRRGGTRRAYELEQVDEPGEGGLDNRGIQLESQTVGAGVPTQTTTVDASGGKTTNFKPYKQYTQSKPKYQDVIKDIVKRFIYYDSQRETTGEGDTDSLKQDVSSFRYEMLNRLGHMESSLKSAVNYVSAKVDLISGGVFDDSRSNGNRLSRPFSSVADTRQGAPWRRRDSADLQIRQNQGVSMNDKQAQDAHAQPDAPYMGLISPDDILYKEHLPNRGYSPADLDKLIDLLNDLPQEAVSNIPLGVQKEATGNLNLQFIQDEVVKSSTDC